MPPGTPRRLGCSSVAPCDRFRVAGRRRNVAPRPAPPLLKGPRMKYSTAKFRELTEAVPYYGQPPQFGHWLAPVPDLDPVRPTSTLAEDRGESSSKSSLLGHDFQLIAHFSPDFSGAWTFVPLSQPPPARKHYPDELLTTPEAAAVLRLRPHTLENLRTLGTGPVFHRVGGRVRYRFSDLEEFVNKGRRTSTSDNGSDK